MRRAGCLRAQGHQSIEPGGGAGIRVVAYTHKQRKFSLRRHTLMVAIHRVLAVAQGVGSSLQRLPAPVLSRPSEADDAQQRALRNGEGYGIVGGLGTARYLRAEPYFTVDRTAGAQDLNALLLKRRGEGGRQIGGWGAGWLHLVLGEGQG